jgi:hypothetical protein
MLLQRHELAASHAIGHEPQTIQLAALRNCSDATGWALKQALAQELPSGASQPNTQPKRALHSGLPSHAPNESLHSCSNAHVPQPFASVGEHFAPAASQTTAPPEPPEPVLETEEELDPLETVPPPTELLPPVLVVLELPPPGPVDEDEVLLTVEPPVPELVDALWLVVAPPPAPGGAISFTSSMPKIELHAAAVVLSTTIAPIPLPQLNARSITGCLLRNVS